MTDCVHPAVQAVEPPLLDAMVNRVLAKAHRPKLPVSDHSVLLVGEVRDLAVSRATFIAYSTINVYLDGHGFRVAGGGARNNTPV